MGKTVFERQRDQLIVKPQGRLDTGTSPILEQELRQNLEGIARVTMDFAGVDYISSSGLRVLLALDQRLRERGGRLKLVHVNEHILEIFELVGFMEMVDVEQD